MTVKNGEQRMKTVMLVEFLGTCGLMLAMNLSKTSTQPAVTLFLLMMLTIWISGGHLNPAVTLGIYIERREYAKNLPVMGAMIFSQVTGACFAIFLAYMLRITI